MRPRPIDPRRLKEWTDNGTVGNTATIWEIAIVFERIEFIKTADQIGKVLNACLLARLNNFVVSARGKQPAYGNISEHEDTSASFESTGVSSQ